MTDNELQGPRADRRFPHRWADRGELVSLAHLIGAPVLGADGKRLGRVEDVIARWHDGAARPLVAGVLTKVDRGSVVVDITGAKLSQASVKVGVQSATLAAPDLDINCFVLARELMDHQIVDMYGIQVVRSSDVYLAGHSGGWEVGGIDVGLWSLARRLLPRRRRCPAPSRVIDWTEIHPFPHRSAPAVPGADVKLDVRLRDTTEGLRTLRADQVASLLQGLDRPHQAQLVALTSSTTAVEVLQDLEPSKLRGLLAELDEHDRGYLIAMLQLKPDMR